MVICARQVWFSIASLVHILIVCRMLHREKQDRAQFLASPCHLHRCSACEICSQPALQPAWHVAAYMAMAAVGLPWCAAIVHIFVLVHT